MPSFSSTTPQREGNPNSPICLIGEAPSTEEMREGRPFVGPAGEVLDRCLQTAGVQREKISILNVFNSPVSKDSTGSVVRGATKLFNSRTGRMTEDGQTAISKFTGLLAETKANVYVPLGGTALGCLLPGKQIGKWRGSILEVEGRKLVPTYHPATVCWGSTELQHVIATDLVRAREQSASPTVTRRPRELILDPTIGDVREWFDMLEEQKRLTFFDLELFGGQLSAFSICNDPEMSMCIPMVGQNRSHHWSEAEEIEIIERLARVLGNPEIPKGNQNVTFDIHIMLVLYGIMTRGPLCDPMVLHHVVYPDLPKGLDFLCSWLTDVPYYKDDNGSKAWQDPWRDLTAFWRYSALDTSVALEAWERLAADFLPSSPYAQTYNDTMTTLWPIVAMMLIGQRVDPERFSALQKQTLADLKRVRAEFEELTQLKFNIVPSPKQLCELFYDRLGYERYLKDGKPTTDIFALRRLARKGCKEASLLMEFRSLSKLKGTYCDMKLRDGRFFNSYNIRGAKTGRFASEATQFEDGGNSQNLAPVLKSCIVPDYWREWA